MILRVDGLSKAWKGYRLKEISLEIAPGEYFVLLGPTGAGKTLLLEAIVGLHKLDSGKITLNGVDITDFPTEKRGIGYVPQQSNLFPHMTVRQNVEFGLKIRSVPSEIIGSKADAILNELGIYGLAERAPLSLSGGEKQKVALARVMAVEPSLILLDEPLSAVDAETRLSLRRYLKEKQSGSGISFLHVTHDQMEAFSMANRIALMMGGEIVQTGAPMELFLKPNGEDVARFLGYENIFRGRIQRSAAGIAVDVGGSVIKTSIKDEEGLFGGGGFCTIGISADGVAISPDDCLESPNCLKGTIQNYTCLGSIVKARILTEGGLTFHAIETTGTFIGKGFDNGKKIWISIAPDSVKLLPANGKQLQ